MITSLSNPGIVAVRKLLQAKERKTTRAFLAEGLRVVGQAFDSRADIQQVIYCPDLLVSEFGQNLVDRARALGIDTLEVSQPVFNSIARKDTPQGIAAVIGQRWCELKAAAPAAGEIWVGLQAVQNPGNLGTILRTCDAVGAKGLILLDDCTDPYDAAAVKASMGSIFTIRLFKARLAEFQEWALSHPDVSIVGTSDKGAEDYASVRYAAPAVLLLGSEREGLPREYIALCRHIVRIPMEGACDSLNLSVAAGIILYEIYNQNRARRTE
ncbi:MAG: RNA methyltransferase [Chloroflexi bacterium]|jgi:TrmH family RNA methyltransferase|nr:RNA methyltransferase [Anaerolineaceae bacterium]NLI44168.1 RNA methyltransferase [Chloroflexota bacterium]HOE34591.1 RNA methyltransferase [Anaerolineaceae bacterium]HOT24885.1 RNA methyltransferase [Anaerolineaceae bacterium]HQH58410.1 RNA methyltransferase [Anaerolineaceae bacterium]